MRRAAQLVSGAACFLLLAAAQHLAAQPDPVQAWWEGGSAVALGTGLGLRLELPEGRRLEVSLSPGGEVASLVGLGDGWAAAGTYAGADGRRRLWARAGAGNGARALPEPPGQTGRLRQGPVLLADGRRLAGLAWLEGDGLRSLAVRAAAWDGRRWGPAARVSAPGPGSQLALSGTVLADGSWLLAWSAFDGQDDELVWARRVEGRWQPVQRLAGDNAVPDITPALTASGIGALAAWSRFDGSDYRLVLARFQDGRWGEARAVGEPGSLYPTFGGAPGASHLLYLTAQPRGWALLALGEAGQVQARAAVATERDQRPAVAPGPNGTLTLRWPQDEHQAVLRWEEVPR